MLAAVIIKISEPPKVLKPRNVREQVFRRDLKTAKPPEGCPAALPCYQSKLGQ
jgi:hypothetical protein